MSKSVKHTEYISNGFKAIKLGKGSKVAFVDAEDFQRINQHKWFPKKGHLTFYAVRKKQVNKKVKLIYMHREVLNSPDAEHVDHIDHNGLNNCKANLRPCSAEQNQHNKGFTCNSKSKYKGVTWHNGKWRARITHQKKQIHIGHFKSEIDAAMAYDKKASELFGEFAFTNFSRRHVG